MARFVTLNFHAACSCVAAMLGLMGGLSTLQAQAPMTPMAPAPMTAAPVKPPAANAAPAVPSPLPDTLGRYGKILTPGDQIGHPLKLKMPFPGVGEVKIPNPDEMSMREKLEQLAGLSDADIRNQLDQWPAYGKMSLRDQGTMLQRIQDFRDYRSNVAKAKAHEIGLLTLLPDQQARFEKEYWDKRLQMDHELANQFLPVFRAREQRMKEELFREFSSISPGPVAQVPKPPAPPSPPVAGAPVAQAPR